MAKKAPIIFIICAGIAALSLFLPYKSFDYYTGGLFGTTLAEENLKESGLEHPEAYIPPAAMLIAVVILLLARNMATAIINLILSFGIVLYMFLLAFILTFEIFSPRRNIDVESGFYLASLAALTFFIMSIVHLIRVIRERRNARPAIADDLLDDLDM